MIGSLTLLLLMNAGSRPSPVLDEIATGLVSQLALPSVEGFGIEDDVAVQAAGLGEIDRLLPGLILSRLHALGAETAFIQEAGPSPDLRARNQGAEWLLLITGKEVPGAEGPMLKLWAELRQVDRGFWVAPPPADSVPIARTARAQMLLELSAPRAPMASGTESDPQRPGLYGPALRIRAVVAKVIALAACRLSHPTDDDLVILTKSALEVYTFRRGRLRRLGRTELGDLPTSAAPSREAFGRVVCMPSDSGPSSLAVGHSGLSLGYVLKASSRKKKWKLQIVGEVPGVPILLAPKNREWLYARTIEGTSRIQLLRGERISQDLLDVVTGPAGMLAVTPRYEVIRLQQNLSFGPVLGKSGMGIFVFSNDNGEQIVTTSYRPGDQDEVALIHGQSKERGRPISVKGQVQATAVGRFRGLGQDLVVASWQGAQTDLWLLRTERK